MLELEQWLVNIGMSTRYYRRLRHLSQRQLAEKAQLSLSHVQKIEFGTINSSISTYLKISFALQIELTMLLRDFNNLLDSKDHLLFQKDLKSLAKDKDFTEVYQAIVKNHQIRKDLEYMRTVKLLKSKKWKDAISPGFINGSVIDGKLYLDDSSAKAVGFNRSVFAHGEHLKDQRLAVYLSNLVDSIPVGEVLGISAVVDLPIGETRIQGCYYSASKKEKLMVAQILETQPH